MSSNAGKVHATLAKLFQDEGRFYRLLLVSGGIVAVLKGLRMPYNWAATQVQIDYRYGFMRRGLFGEVCRQLHLPIWRYEVFTVLAFLLLACFLAVLAWCVRRSGLDAAGFGAFSALIAGSFCITSLVNIVGYFDALMALLVLLGLLLRDARLQLVAVALLGVVGVLVHELYAIAFLPVALLGPICWASEGLSDEHGGRVRWSRWLSVACAAIVPWIIVFSIGRAEITPARAEELKVLVHDRVNFEAFVPLFNVLRISSAENLKIMEGYLRAGAWWVEEALALAAFLPTACYFLAVAWHQAAGRARAVRCWLVVSTFAPLLLNFVGFDRYRWLALMSLNAFLSAIALSYANLRLPVRDAAAACPVLFSVDWRRAAVFLLAINLATDIGFFEGRAKSFPFRDFWVEYREGVQAKRPLLQPEGIFPKLPR